MVRLLWLVSALLLMTSCKMMVARLAGIYKKPQIESQSSIQRYYETYNAKADAYYALREAACLDSLGVYFGRLPSAMVFNSDKELVYIENQENCTWKTFSEIAEGSFKGEPIEDKPVGMFDAILGCAFPIAPIDSSQPSKFHLFLTWAKFLPKQAQGAFELVNEVHSQSGGEYKIHLINFDRMEDWEAE